MVEIGDGPIRTKVEILLPDGRPYSAGLRPGEPKRVGQPIPMTSDPPARQGGVTHGTPPAPAGEGVEVLFEVGEHPVTSVFDEVSTSAGGTYLVLDVTTRPKAFLPFHHHLKAYHPRGEVISALPAGGDTAFSLAIDERPPIGILIGGRKVYLVPIVETADVGQHERREFAAQADTAPAFEELDHERAADGEDGGRRGAHPAGPVPGGDFVPYGSDDPGVELRLPGEDGGDDAPRGPSSVLA